MALTAWDTDPNNANSYVTNAQADTYFGDAIHGAPWTAASETTQDQALVTATRMLDRAAWAGSKTSSSQPLEWPRTGAVDRDGVAISTSVIPTAIREATYELALVLVNNSEAQSGTPAVKTISTGMTSVTFANATATQGQRLPPIVMGLAGALLASAQLNARPVAYGLTDDNGDDMPTYLDDIEKWDRTEPFD